MRVRLHLRRVRVVGVLVDLMERLVVEIADVRRVVRCPHCGFNTTRVHDRRRLVIRDLPTGGRPTTLEWVRRRFSCAECSERHWEDHPEIILGRRTHVTRRLARQLVRDVNIMSIREVTRRHDLPWHFIMGLTRSWSERVAADRRRRRRRVLLVDETSLRRGHRYVTVVINGDIGETLAIVPHRNSRALNTFLVAQGHRWLKGVRVVVSDGSVPYRSSIQQHLGHATHLLDRFRVARWFAAGMIEVRRRIQRIGPHGSRPAFDPQVFRSRYLQLTRFDQLPADRIEALGKVLAGRPELEAAWRMLQHLYGIHLATDSDQANQALGTFLEVYADHPLIEFEKLTGTLLEWGDEIFASHDTDRATNGRIEGTNNKLGVLKRIAYGFTNASNFAHRALLLTPGMATSP
ncbi:MAG: ISL3 family transposase [Actinobacteria bacterium]|nr:ISL3 family transposase [Actinomycetota bacterium]